MDTLRRMFRWLSSGWNLKARERELDAELQFHLEEEAEEREAAGLPPEEARFAARRDLGNLANVKESTREAWGWVAIEGWWQDLRYGMRSLRKSRTLALTALVSLALGIGANTAIYSVINAVMLRPLPLRSPHELVRLEIKGGQSGPYFTNPLWEGIRDSQDAFAGVVAYAQDRFNISEGVEGHFVRGLWVSGSYFKVLGVPAWRGRVLTSRDDRHGCGSAGPVAVISYDFWQREFQGGPSAVGRTLPLNREKFTIVGVTPPWWKGLNRDRPYDIAIPIGCEPLLHSKSSLDQPNWWLQIVGRMKPGATLQGTEDRINTLAPQIFFATLPPNISPGFRKTYLDSTLELTTCATGFSWVRKYYRTALFALMAIAALVLLTACANIANLLLARAKAKQHEFAMRKALGASRWRLIRQLMIESLLLSGLGACGGFLLALWSARILVHLISTPSRPVELNLTPNLHLLGFMAAVTIVTTLVFGLVPALRATRGGLNHSLQERGLGGVHRSSRFRLGRGVAVVQTAMSFVLLLAAGLFVGTLRNSLNVDLGFQPNGVLLVSVDLQQLAKGVPERRRAYTEILGRLRELPGVTSASASLLTPMGNGGWNEWVTADSPGKTTPTGALMYRNRVSSGYFQTLGTPFIAGRDFNESDRRGPLPAMVINQSAARKFFGSANPLGKTIRSGNPTSGRLYQVVGVVKDEKYGSVDEKPRVMGFDTMGQSMNRARFGLNFELRHNVPLRALTPEVRAAISNVSPNISIEFRSLKTQVDESLQQQRLVAALSTVFGGLALLLCVLGLYGLTAYSVSRRRAEVGLRVALGASTGSILWLILRPVAAVLVAGTAFGVLGALAARKLVASLLFGVAPNSPLYIFGVALVLSTATMVAAFLPAWRAAHLDPAKVLREQ